MANQHYCSVHNTAYFKAGRMKGYAHKIEGTEPVEWCNEEAELLPEMQEHVDQTLKEAKEMTRPKSDGKNRSFALSYAKDWCIAQVNGGKDLKVMDVITVAVAFESYLDNGATVTAKKGDTN